MDCCIKILRQELNGYEVKFLSWLPQMKNHCSNSLSKANSMKIHQIFLSLTGMALVLIFHTSCTGETNSKKRGSENVIPVRNLTTVTAKLNGGCPEMVDEDTRLDSILFIQEGLLSYNYTLFKQDKSSINETVFQAYLIPRILNNVHANRDLKMYRDSSVTFVFNYWDRNGVLITEFTLGPEKYQ